MRHAVVTYAVTGAGRMVVVDILSAEGLIARGSAELVTNITAASSRQIIDVAANFVAETLLNVLLRILPPQAAM